MNTYYLYTQIEIKFISLFYFLKKRPLPIHKYTQCRLPGIAFLYFSSLITLVKNERNNRLGIVILITILPNSFESWPKEITCYDAISFSDANNPTLIIFNLIKPFYKNIFSLGVSCYIFDND